MHQIASPRHLRRWLLRSAAGLLLAIMLGLVAALIYARSTRLPPALNMSSAMDSMPMAPGMPMAHMPISSAGATSLTQLVAPPSSAPIKTFTLTAMPARIDPGDGQLIDAMTLNGSVPGPTLRVQQGDQVVVHVINHLSVSTSIHWHGISVPNAEDGVAGVTQDAIQPGQSYTYRFIATDTGTYWYHSHQDTAIQVPRGMYGALVVDPRQASEHDDLDQIVFLHEWGAPDGCRATCPETLSLNDQRDQLRLVARPGSQVRIRLINSGEDGHVVSVIGAPVRVIALDGHDLNRPTPLSGVNLAIGPAQRIDIRMQVPLQQAITLIDSDERATPAGQHPRAIIGDATAPAAAVPADLSSVALFDPTSYGSPASDPISLQSHFDEQYSLNLGSHLGMFNGQFTMLFTINDQAYPAIPAILVRPGDLVKLHFTNTGGMLAIPHPMHLHGHVFTLLAQNGKPLSGSPVHLDTLVVQPDESYDVAFVANNPGLWMLHCHIVDHDGHGMDMMVVYPHIATPYTIGSASGNNPF